MWSVVELAYNYDENVNTVYVLCINGLANKKVLVSFVDLIYVCSCNEPYFLQNKQQLQQELQ